MFSENKLYIYSKKAHKRRLLGNLKKKVVTFNKCLKI